ncbi:MAG: hypothetical protein HQ517_13965 [SAR324 cluster bacterium]|nr:hypothetical protein [SAR324 cluster bacterium]
MSLAVKKIVICLLLIAFVFGEVGTIFGQTDAQNLEAVPITRAQPPMKNVFWNVIWGSFNGGMLMMSWSILDDSVSSDERYKLSRISGEFFRGATYGGLMGMAVGIYFSIKGVTFDESRSRIAFYPASDRSPEVQRFFNTSSTAKAKNSVNLFNFHFKF